MMRAYNAEMHLNYDSKISDSLDMLKTYTDHKAWHEDTFKAISKVLYPAIKFGSKFIFDAIIRIQLPKVLKKNCLASVTKKFTTNANIQKQASEKFNNRKLKLNM
jgi:hypothetical protein